MAAPPLTKRQTEVLQMVAEGYTNRQMALQLSVSLKTVEKHRQSLMDKLNIHQVAKLTRYAVSSGVVESHLSPKGTIPAGARWHTPEAACSLAAGTGNTS